jgi:hypothetical protein
MVAKSLSSASIFSQNGNLLEPSTRIVGSKGDVYKVGFELVASSSLDKSRLGKSDDLQINFIFLPSLSKSRDEIPVKWGRICNTQNF